MNCPHCGSRNIRAVLDPTYTPNMAQCAMCETTFNPHDPSQPVYVPQPPPASPQPQGGAFNTPIDQIGDIVMATLRAQPQLVITFCIVGDHLQMHITEPMQRDLLDALASLAGTRQKLLDAMKKQGYPA